METLRKQIDQVFREVNFPWQVVWVDDASTDETFAVLNEFGSNHLSLTNVVRRGQSTCIMQGIRSSSYEFIGIIDGDGQNDPKDILRMYQEISKDLGLDFVQGRRRIRQDRLLTRRIPSIVANRIVSLFTGIRLDDIGCATKVFRRHIADEIPFKGEIHRLYAAHAYLSNFSVIQIDVSHFPRRYGKSSYGLSRIPKFVLDITLLRLRHKALKNPFYLLGFTSILMIGTGVLMWLAALFLKLNQLKDYLDGALTVGGLLCVLIGIALLVLSVTFESLFYSNARTLNGIHQK